MAAATRVRVNRECVVVAIVTVLLMHLTVETGERAAAGPSGPSSHSKVPPNGGVYAEGKAGRI